MRKQGDFNIETKINLVHLQKYILEKQGWHYSVENFYDLSPFSIEKGGCYILRCNKGSFIGGKLIKSYKPDSKMKRFLNRFVFFKRKKPNGVSPVIATNLNLFLENHRIFESNTRVWDLLKKYHFKEQEIIDLMREFNLDYNKQRCRYLDSFHKSILLINICLKKSSVLVFHVVGLDYGTATYMCNYIYDKIKSTKDKAAIIIDDSSDYNKESFILPIPKEALEDYGFWYKSLIK